MGSRLLLCSAAAAIAAALTPCRIAAQFQEPTRDELQMKADPQAPDSAAVFLYREDVTDVANRTRTFYARIKVLSEAGKEAATVSLPFNPYSQQVEADGRTVHADGTVAPMVEKPAEIPEYESRGYRRSKMVFTLPSAEVGCILEYRIIVRSKFFPEDPTWMVQQSYFAHKEHFAYLTLNTAKYSYISRLVTDAKVADDGKGHYTLDVSNVPAVPDEDWMPPLNTYRWRVMFFMSRFTKTEDFWREAQKNWADEVAEYIKPTGTLKKIAAEITGDSGTETEKAKKIYAAVMKLENTDYTRQKTRAERKKEKIKDIHKVEDVWKEQGGDSDQIALLFVALSRAAGLNVVPMQVVDRDRATFDASLLTSRQLDDYIAVAKLDGEEVFLDPGEKMCRFGLLHWRHALSAGFKLVGDNATFAHTPGGKAQATSISRVADLTVDATGQVKGTVRVALSGQESLRWRQLALLSDEQTIQKLFTEWMKGQLPAGSECEFDHFLSLDDYETNLLAVVQVSGISATLTGKRMFLPGQFFASRSRQPFVSLAKRTLPVDVKYAHTESDQVTYRLPSGFKAESGPPKKDIDWAGYGSYAVTASDTQDTFSVTRDLANDFAILKVENYGELHTFYQNVTAADQAQLVLIASNK